MVQKKLRKFYYLKKIFTVNQNMEDITDVDYMHTKGVCKDIKIKHMGEYCDSHVQNDVLLLDHAFKNF